MKLEMKNEYISLEVREAGNRNINKVKIGSIRNHKLGNSAVEHSGEMEENEMAQYFSFLPTMTCNMILELKGNHSYE